MANEVIGSASAQADSLTLPAHLAGDLLLIMARSGTLTPPSLPAGWTSIQAGSADNPAGAFDVSARLGYKIAASDSETSGTWTGASFIVAHVYRGASDIGGSAVASSTGTSPSAIPAVTMTVTDGSSWIAGFIGSRNDIGPASGPDGLTLRQEGTPTTPRVFGYDTAGGVSSWSASEYTWSGTTANVSIAAEILATVPSPPPPSGVAGAGFDLVEVPPWPLALPLPLPTPA